MKTITKKVLSLHGLFMVLTLLSCLQVGFTEEDCNHELITSTWGENYHIPDENPIPDAADCLDWPIINGESVKDFEAHKFTEYSHCVTVTDDGSHYAAGPNENITVETIVFLTIRCYPIWEILSQNEFDGTSFDLSTSCEDPCSGG